MSGSTFFVSEAAVRNLKDAAQRRISGIQSSHLSEAIAAALGFKTNAGLRAAFKDRPTVEVPKPNNAKLAERLRKFGYAVPDGVRLVPEFEHSYSPFKSFPLRKQRSARWLAWRNLMVAAINAGIEKRLFGLSQEDNWWPGGAPHSQRCQAFTYHFVLQGLSCIASVDAISGDELAIAVVTNPRDESNAPGCYSSLEDGDATAQGWVERRLGAWLQDGGEAFHAKRALQPRLAKIEIAPLGYSDQGPFFM